MDRKEKIYHLLLDASEKSFSKLFEVNREHFYYCSLVMMECATPCITALSEEAYRKLLEENAAGENSSGDDKAYYRWAYAESPYLGFGYEEYFSEVSRYYSQDVSYALSGDEFEKRINDWLQAMVTVMETLKQKGMFMESGNDEVFLLAEQQPSDTDYNIENARALNNETLFEVWYKDNYIL